MPTRVCRRGCRARVTHTLDHWLAGITMAVCLLLSLFLPDIATWAFPPSADLAVSYIMLGLFLVFAIETAMLLYAGKADVRAFLFWLDVCATISILLDFHLIKRMLEGNDSGELDVTRTTKAARLGTKAARVLKIIRVLRMLRFGKLLRIYTEQLGSESKRNVMSASGWSGGKDWTKNKRANGDVVSLVSPPHDRRAQVFPVGNKTDMVHRRRIDTTSHSNTNMGGKNLWQKVGESSTEKVIFAVLAVLVLVPILDLSPIDMFVTLGNGLLLVERLHDPQAQDLALFNATLNDYIQQEIDPPVVLLNMSLKGVPVVSEGVPASATAIASLRNSEVMKLKTNNATRAWWSRRAAVELEAKLNVAQMVFVGALLVVAALLLNIDTYVHVVKPIKRMTAYVQNITETSLSKALLPKDRVVNNLETELLHDSLAQVGLMLKKSDELLLELLPQGVLSQLLRGARIIANTYERVSLLYTDLVGFTRIASTMTPKELVTWMNQLYRTFDFTVELNGCYKVETVGDAYIVTAGCPDNELPPSTNARNTIEAAIDMLDAMDIVKDFLGLDALDMRCGVHTGSIVAGVINKKNPRFHIFGENCTIASKMESGGVPGRIQCSDTTARLVDHLYHCEQRNEPVEVMEGKTVSSVLIGRGGDAALGDDIRGGAGGRAAPEANDQRWMHQLGFRRRQAWKTLLKPPESLMQKEAVLALLEQTTK